MVAGDDEARPGAAQLAVTSYDVLIDLLERDGTFRSRSDIRFDCRSGAADLFADIKPVQVLRASLNGSQLPQDCLAGGNRLPLSKLLSSNRLTVEAEFAYTSGGGGISRIGSAAEGVYSKANRHAASKIFCSFDQPHLRAPFTCTVRTPSSWTCRSNFPTTSRTADGGHTVWRFAPTVPLAPYLFAVCAGPNELGHLCSTDDRQSTLVNVFAPGLALDVSAGENVRDLIVRSLVIYEHIFDVGYPYPKFDAIFVPNFSALAYSPPGLAILRASVLATSSTQPLYLSCVIAHEVAHSWIGGLIDMRFDADMWLQEALTTYVSRIALEQLVPGAAPWSDGLSSTLPDHAYTANADKLRKLEGLIGRQPVLAGLRALMKSRPHHTITKLELIDSWTRASGEKLQPWADREFRPSPS